MLTQLEFKALPEGGLFLAGMTLRELAALPALAGAREWRLVRYDDLEPFEKKAKAHGLKILWSGDAPLPLPPETLLTLFGDEKWALCDLEADLPSGATARFSGWENRFWKLSGLPAREAFIDESLAAAFALPAERARPLAALAREWLEPGVYARRMEDGSLRVAAMLRARSRVYLGLEAQPFGDIRLRVIPPDGTDGPVARVNQLSILTMEACLYDQLALGAALVFLFAGLLCAGMTVLAWKRGWPLAGVFFALAFLFCCLYAMRLAGARED